MARFKKFIPKKEESKIIYKSGIVDGIVLLSISELEFVELYTPVTNDNMKSKAIKISYEKDALVIDVMVKIHYSQSVSDIAFRVQEAIRHNIESMTEYKISSVNVIVNGVMFDEPKPTVVNSDAETGKDSTN